MTAPLEDQKMGDTAPSVAEKASMSQHVETSRATGLSPEDAEFLEAVPPQEQDRIFRKVDLHLVPLLAILYLFANLDRANIGNAKIEGLEKSLGMKGTDYNVASSIFFVSYILCEVPSNAILIRFKKPSTFIGLIVTLWGIVMTLSGVVTNFAGLVATRLLLGIFEAGFFPGAIFLISQWYPPKRMQLRMALMYGAAALSGAFSGLLAAAIAKMSGLGGYEGWRWIFLLEGVFTVLCGVATFWLLPDSPDSSARWLTERDIRFLKLTYVKYRGGGRSQEDEREDHQHRHSSWRVLRSVLGDWQLYLQAMIFMSSSVPTYALKFTLPTLVLNMGFTSTQAQLLTAPPYILGAFSAVFSALFADRLAWRFPFIAAPQTLLAVSFAVLFVYSADVARTVAVCYTFVNVSTISSYPIVPGGNTWTANNLAPQPRRAVGIAFMIAVGNVGGIVGSFIFRDAEAPRYPTGWGTCIGFVVAGVVCASLLEAGYLAINRRRARTPEDEVRDRYSDYELEQMGDRSPLFKYAL